MASSSSSSSSSSIYEENPMVFRLFAVAYAVVALLALRLLLQAQRQQQQRSHLWQEQHQPTNATAAIANAAAHSKRWTVQKALLVLAATMASARAMTYIGNVDYRLHYYIQHLFNAVVYFCVFTFHSVLLYFMHAFVRLAPTTTAKFR